MRKGMICKKKLLSAFLVIAMALTNMNMASIDAFAAAKTKKLTLNADSKSLTVGQKYVLKVKKTVPKNASKAVTWKSSKKSVAVVSKKGKVTAKKAGTATITAVSRSNKKIKAVCKIKVYDKVKKITLNVKKKTMKEGESFTLKGKVSPSKADKRVSYKSSNTKVLTVSSKGKVTAKTAGVAKVTVISKSNKKKKAECVVTVTKKNIVNSPTPEPQNTAAPTPTSGVTNTPTPKPTNTVTPIPTVTPNPILKDNITKAEWVTALLQAMDCGVEENNLEKDADGNIVYHFSDISDSEYAAEIETAYIYGYITSDNSSDVFEPESGVTREYAVMTAVNALGIGAMEDISCTDSNSITYKTQVSYAVKEGMLSLENGMFFPDRILTEKEQEQIVNRLAQIRTERSASAVITPMVEYAKEVVAAKTEQVSSYTVSETGEGTYRIQILESNLTSCGIAEENLVQGKTLVLPAAPEVPNGMAVLIESTENNNGTWNITGTSPKQISQVYEHVVVSGTADAGTQTIEAEEGVTVEEVNGEKEIVISEQAINAAMGDSLGELYSKETSFKPNDYVSGKIIFKIPDVSYYIDVEFPWLETPKVNQVSLTLKESLKVETNLQGSVSGSIPVGETNIPIKEIPGLAIKAKITLEYSASGNVNFVFQAEAQQTLGVKGNALFKETPKPSVTENLTIEAEGKAGPKLSVSLIWPNWTKDPAAVLFDADTELGIGMKGNSTTHAGNGEVSYFHCMDGKIYFYLDAAVITRDCILYDLCHKDWKIFDENNSPIRWHGHWENGAKVDKCTWSADITPTETPVPTKPGTGGGSGGSSSSGGNYAGLTGPRTDTAGNVTYDCVYFGSYPQSDATGQTKEPIKWRILSVNGTEAFLVADQNMDVYRYNETYEDVTWETSTIRSWLNGYDAGQNICGVDYTDDNFISRAFTSAEQAAIPYTTVVNEDNPEYGTEGGNDTQDKVYLLSIAEVSDSAYGFLPYEDENDDWICDNARERTNTAYVASGGTINSEYMNSSGSNHWWWLRSPGYYSFSAADVDGGVVVNRDGCLVGDGNEAVCPALHLNLSSTDVWSNAGTVTIER